MCLEASRPGAVKKLQAAGTTALRERVNLHDGDARAVTYAVHDGGEGRTRRQGPHNGRFQIVRGRYRAVDDGLFIGAIHPVVVRFNYCSIAIVQLESGIGQGPLNAKAAQRGSNRANDYFERARPGDENAREHDVVPSLDK